jgi:hypothetical protein
MPANLPCISNIQLQKMQPTLTSERSNKSVGRIFTRRFLQILRIKLEAIHSFLQIVEHD